MCGIVGVVLKKEKQILNDLVLSLKKLEYRGYDSCGICEIVKNKFYTVKSLKNIEDLNTKAKQNVFSTAICHTRWATHGEVSLQNTHPHFDCFKTYSVVHNGIIENYLQLKTLLKNNGYNFYGETDSEVIPNLINFKNKNNNLLGFCEAIKMLSGSFSILAINKNQNNVMYLARKNSPLYVAKNDNFIIASSDPICFYNYFKNYYTLKNNSICLIKNNNLYFYDFNLNKINAKLTNLGEFENSNKLNNFKYYAQKEINEIPEVLNKIINTYNKTNYFKKINKQFLNDINKIYLIGCGTSYHATLLGKYFLNKFTNIFCESFVASEFKFLHPKIDSNTLCIFVSQSGETADCILCLNYAKNKKAKILSVVNVPYSTLAKKGDIFLPLCCGMEIAVISTKAFCSMILVLYFLSLHIKNILENKNTKINKNINKLTKINIQNIFDSTDDYVDEILKNNKIIFLGKSSDFYIAKEASLKLKEITYINCICLPSNELKHGTMALVDNKTFAIFIVTKKDVLNKNLSSINEVKTRGGKVAIFTTLKIDKTLLKNVDYVFYLQNIDTDLNNIVSIIPFQVIAFKTCLKLNLSPDKPRNLAKSVTVE